MADWNFAEEAGQYCGTPKAKSAQPTNQEYELTMGHPVYRVTRQVVPKLSIQGWYGCYIGPKLSWGTTYVSPCAMQIA